MKKITTTILVLFVLSSACLLNAQMEVYPDGSVSIGNKTASITKVGINGNTVQIGNTAAQNSQITIDNMGTFNIGNITNPQLILLTNDYVSLGNTKSRITFNPDGNIGLGRATSPQIQIKNDGKTVSIFDYLFEATSGSLKILTSSMDFLLDNSSISLNSLYSQIKIDHLGLISIGSKTNPQLTINRNGNVQLGNSNSIVNIGSGQIKVNSNTGSVHIGNTSEPLFDDETRFELNVPKATIRYTDIHIWASNLFLLMNFLLHIANQLMEEQSLLFVEKLWR
jgi:hypothetical protein